MEECFKGEEKDRNEGKDWGGLTDRTGGGMLNWVMTDVMAHLSSFRDTELSALKPTLQRG